MISGITGISGKGREDFKVTSYMLLACVTCLLTYDPRVLESETLLRICWKHKNLARDKNARRCMHTVLLAMLGLIYLSWLLKAPQKLEDHR